MTSKAMAIAAALCALAGLALGGCGTVAGNPKKPDTTDTKNPSPGSGLFEAALPLIDFDIGESTFALSDGLFLAEQDFVGKTFFNAYGRRINGILRELNATAKRVNALTKVHGERSDDGNNDGKGGTIRFKGQGRSMGLSARISEIQGQAAYNREAVLCAKGKPYQLLRWTTSTKELELWRDFRVSLGEGETKLSVVTRLRTKPAKDGSLALDLSTLGTWTDADADADEGDGRGSGLVERMFVDKGTNGVVALRAVTDRFEGQVPARFDADAWFVGRMIPLQTAGRGYDPTFVAYSASSLRAGCRAGFDEEAADLWNPNFLGPRFCLGRAAGGTPLTTPDLLRKHIASFEDIGLAKAKELEVVALPSGLACQ